MKFDPDAFFDKAGRVISALGAGLLMGPIGGAIFGAITGVVAGMMVVMNQPVQTPPRGLGLLVWENSVIYAIPSAIIALVAGPIGAVVGRLTRSRFAGAIAGMVAGVAMVPLIGVHYSVRDGRGMIHVIGLSGGPAGAGICGIVAGGIRAKGEE